MRDDNGRYFNEGGCGFRPGRAGLAEPELKRLDQCLVCKDGNRDQSAESVSVILSATIGTSSTDCLNIKTPFHPFIYSCMSLH